MSRVAGAVHGHVLAVEQDATAGRQLEAGDHPQRRGLAAAGGAEHHQELAVGDGEARVLHGDEVAEGLAQVLDADLGHRRYSGNLETTMNIAVPARMVTKDQV